MQRRHFLGSSLPAMYQGAPTQEPEFVAGGTGSVSYQPAVTIERKQAGKPHKGKRLAAIQPHCDDIPIFAGGTVAKLLDEGYEGYLITMSDDSMAGTGSSYGDIVLKNEKDTVEMARRLGLQGIDLPQLSEPQHGRMAAGGDPCTAGVSVPAAEDRHGVRLRSVGAV
ncbi:MAG: PIG-L family deacetylase [Bryobacterales bacterium]|nr:PIG-L family deacetylase [Bryobacterales bacterium]